MPRNVEFTPTLTVGYWLVVVALAIPSALWTYRLGPFEVVAVAVNWAVAVLVVGWLASRIIDLPIEFRRRRATK